MSFNRREFLLAAAAGLTFHTFVDRAQSYFLNRGEPLLLTPKRPNDVLYARSHGVDSGYELLYGDPEFSLPSMSWREFAEWEGMSLDEMILDNWGWPEEDYDPDSPEWDKEADPMSIYESMPRTSFPSGAAHEYLFYLDLGPQFGSGKGAGDLRFIDGDSPGNDYLGVEAADALTLSLLQQRLNELGQSVSIVLI